MDGSSFQSPQDLSYRRWRRRNVRSRRRRRNIRSRRRYRKKQAEEALAAFYSNATDGRFVQPTWHGDIDEFLAGVDMLYCARQHISAYEEALKLQKEEDLKQKKKKARRARRQRLKALKRENQEYMSVASPAEDLRRSLQPSSSKDVDTFLSSKRVLDVMVSINGLRVQDHIANVKKLMARVALLRGPIRLAQLDNSLCAEPDDPDFFNTPLIWDTGASFGLTPYRSDFIDYEEVSIPVKDITKTSMVVGIGTVMYKMTATNGDVLFVPGLSYHLPESDIRLMSPQAYHKLYGGCSVVDGEKVDWRLNKQFDMSLVHRIEIPINEETNLPMLFNVTCTEEERTAVGPHFTKVCAHLRHARGFFFGKWSVTEEEVNYEFDDFLHLFPCVTREENMNLTAAQKALLLWHFKLGISMQDVQQLMKSHTAVLEDGTTQIFPPVLKAEPPEAATCPLPPCPTCKLASAKRTKSPSPSTSKKNPSKVDVLARDRYVAGDFVSSDQFKVPVPGRRLFGFGKEKDEDLYTCGTVYHDMATSYIHMEFQSDGSAEETLIGKIQFEQFLGDFGVTIKHLHSDNGIYIAKDFREDCARKGQKQTFSGVGSQFENGAAERAIQTIFWMARSMMLHVALRWNEHEVDSPRLWPFAVKHALWIYNRLPNRVTGLTPLERLSGAKDDHRDLRRAHVWGAPCYVLDPKLQSGKKLPKFDKRARLGQYLGFSPEHSSLVALVRHLGTGYVSPQWHVVFDDKFESVFSAGIISDEEFDKICSTLYDDSRDHYVPPSDVDEDGNFVYYPPPLEDVWLTEEERRENRTRVQEWRDRLKAERCKYEDAFVPKEEVLSQVVEFDPIVEEIDAAPSDGASPVSNSVPEGASVPESEGDDVESPDPDADDEVFDEDVPFNEEDALNSVDNKWSKKLRDRSTLKKPAKLNSITWEDALKYSPRDMAHLSASQRSFLSKSEYRRFLAHFAATLGPHTVPPRAARLSAKKQKYRQRMAAMIESSDNLLMQMELKVPSVEELMASPLAKFIHLAVDNTKYSGSTKELIANYVHPLFLKAKAQASSEDNPNWNQAMYGDAAEEYWDACKVEIATLEKMESWEVVDIPEGKHILGSTWAFRLKRYPDGRPKKYKARFVARGDQQIKDVEYKETYAPVVSWATVRLMLILECMLGLKSCQADVECAFLHGHLEEGEEIYMHMPRGFKQEGKCLRLKRSLYGLKQAPRAFHTYLVKALEKQGMKQSHLDPCLFIGDKVVAVTFVDDCLFWAKDEKDINELLVRLRSDEEHGLLLEKEGDAAGFLGVDLKKKNGQVEMTQTGLIDRIITALGLEGGGHYPKATPASHKPLVRDTDGVAAEGAFSYSSVVGMLLYLAGHSRPDIAYAVNCCARYMFSPRKSHEEALIRIGLYLKGTRDKGLILTPNSSVLNVEAFPDADFGGLYGHEHPSDPACVKSRTGFVIKVANCPVLWKSQLQSSKTALSTMEAEITALAHCCRELFPLIDMVKSLSQVYGLEEQAAEMKVSIHEDNAGALLLAQTLPPQFTPRSKWYHIETVWFREEIVKRGIKLMKICTTEQLGDIFTKGLSKDVFQTLRKKLMGW